MRNELTTFQSTSRIHCFQTEELRSAGIVHFLQEDICRFDVTMDDWRSKARLKTQRSFTIRGEREMMRWKGWRLMFVECLWLVHYLFWTFLKSPEKKKKKQDDGWMDPEKDTLWRTSLNAGCILGVAIILSLDWLINVTYLTITTVSPSEIRTMIWQCISACYSQSLSINCNQETMCIQTSSNVSASSLRFLGVATQRPKLPKHIRQGHYMTIWW